MLAFRMPVEFTVADVEAIAALAHLELDPGEAELYARQLGQFLGYATTLQAVDTTGVAPMAHAVQRHDRDRPDQVRPSLDREEALAAAPDPAESAGMFRVPRVIVRVFDPRREPIYEDTGLEAISPTALTVDAFLAALGAGSAGAGPP